MEISDRKPVVSCLVFMLTPEDIMPTKSERLDVELTERGIVETRSLAQRLVMEGKVRVNGQVVLKPSEKVKPEDELVLEAEPRFVSRGGEKLVAALEAFEILPVGWICADVGSSTGGFTDCLLQHGAEKVYAIDVGYGILHWKLRNDPRVVSMERTNARFIEHLPEPVQFVTIDASFISLNILLPAVKGWFGENGGQVVALIKPQFEAGQKEVSKGEGVITDPEIHRQVVEKVKAEAEALGYKVKGVITSPLKGPKGNTEFLIWLEWGRR